MGRFFVLVVDLWLLQFLNDGLKFLFIFIAFISCFPSSNGLLLVHVTFCYLEDHIEILP